MYKAINPIDADRKNSLPVADFTNRYLSTRTPVVFGDLSRRWAAYENWDLEYLKENLQDIPVDVFSNHNGLNNGNSLKPVGTMQANDYFELLETDEDDLQIRELDIFKYLPGLSGDIEFPRLGLTFKRHLTRFSAGGYGARENMHYRSDLAESFLCNFGGQKTVLLVHPDQAQYTYEPPSSFESVLTVDYSEEGLERNPALKKLTPYRATLDHGDILYIPSGFRYSVDYHEISFGLTLVSPATSPFAILKARKNKYLTKPLDKLGQMIFGNSWQKRKLRRAVRRSKR